MRNLGDVGDDTDMELVMMIKMGKTVKIIMLMIMIGLVIDTCCGRELSYDSCQHAADYGEEVDVCLHQPALPTHQMQVVGQGETLPGTLHQQASKGAGMQAV